MARNRDVLDRFAMEKRWKIDGKSMDVLIPVLQAQGAHRASHRAAQHTALAHILRLFIIFGGRDGVNVVGIPGFSGDVMQNLGEF